MCLCVCERETGGESERDREESEKIGISPEPAANVATNHTECNYISRYKTYKLYLN